MVNHGADSEGSSTRRARDINLFTGNTRRIGAGARSLPLFVPSVADPNYVDVSFVRRARDINLGTGNTRNIGGALRSSVYPAFAVPVMYTRSGTFGSTSSSFDGGSSSGTAGSAAAFGTSAAGRAQSSSLHDGTAGATSGLAATHNVYGANRAIGSSAEGGTSSSSGGYGAASGLGYSNYEKGQFQIGNAGNQKGYSGYSSGRKAGRFVGSSRPEIYAGGYALEHGGMLGQANNYRYVGANALGSNVMNKGYGRRVSSNLFAGHGGANALEGTMGGYKLISANALGGRASTYDNKVPSGYIGGFPSDSPDSYWEGGIGPDIGVIIGGKGLGYDEFGYSKETEQSNNGYEGVGVSSDDSLGANGRAVVAEGDHYEKQGYAGNVNYLGDGFEDQWVNSYGPTIMGGGDSNEGQEYIGAQGFENTHSAYAGKGSAISAGAGGYGNLLIGSSSSSGHGGSSSATSGYGAALAASAEGRVHSSSLHEGASEATSGLAAAMGLHGKNKALGSSSEKGTSTGTGGMAAANALGGIASRFGGFGSSSSSGRGGSSSGTSGYGAAMGMSSFGRAQSSSLHDGTSGATSGMGATQGLYGSNRASGSSSAGGTSSSTGGYGAASGLGYYTGGAKPRGHQMPTRRYPEDEYGVLYRSYYGF